MREEKNVLCLWLLIYGLVFSFFRIMPALLPGFFRKPLTWGDILDFFTPFVVIPLAYFLYSRAKEISWSLNLPYRIQSVAAQIVLAIGFLLFVDGHGLHLSANCIARFLQNTEKSELFKATYLFDEIISHFMWDGGGFLISLGLIISASKISIKSLSRVNLFFIVLGAVFYGFSFTVSGIEGQTVIFTFPASCLGVLFTLLLHLKGRKEDIQNPFILFFLIGYILSLLLLTYWGITHSGFPQFSELGWI